MRVFKPDLVDQLREFGYTKKDAISIIEDFSALILKNIELGNTVEVRDFGIFEVAERASRKCHDPITGEPIYIPEHLAVRFRPSRKMRRAVKILEGNVERDDLIAAKEA